MFIVWCEMCGQIYFMTVNLCVEVCRQGFNWQMLACGSELLEKKGVNTILAVSSAVSSVVCVRIKLTFKIFMKPEKQYASLFLSVKGIQNLILQRCNLLWIQDFHWLVNNFVLAHESLFLKIARVMKGVVIIF